MRRDGMSAALCNINCLRRYRNRVPNLASGRAAFVARLILSRSRHEKQLRLKGL